MTPEKVKQFDPSLASIMSNLANLSVSLKFSNSVLVEKILPHCIANSY